MKKYTIFTGSKPLRVDLPDMLQKLRTTALELDQLKKTQSGRRRGALTVKDRKLLEWKTGPFQPQVVGALDPNFMVVIGLLQFIRSVQFRLDAWAREGMAEADVPDEHLQVLAHGATVGYTILETIHSGQEQGLTGPTLDNYLQTNADRLMDKRGLTELTCRMTEIAMVESLCSAFASGQDVSIVLVEDDD